MRRSIASTGATVLAGADLPWAATYGGIMTTAAVARGSIWVACNRLSCRRARPYHGPHGPYFDWPLHKPPNFTDIFRLLRDRPDDRGAVACRP